MRIFRQRFRQRLHLIQLLVVVVRTSEGETHNVLQERNSKTKISHLPITRSIDWNKGTRPRASEMEV